MNQTHTLPRIFAVAVLSFGLGACDTWLGEKEAPPLPGDRISVLQHETSLQPDYGADATQIRLPAPSPTPDWPQNGGLANHAMHHVAAAPHLARRWTTDIGSGSSDEERLTATPIIAEGRVYVIDTDSDVRAFDAETGRELWSTELTPDDEDDGHISGGLAYDDGRVFAGGGFGQVIALDAKTGAEQWRKQLSAPIRSAPTARGGRVFAVTLDNKLHALASHDGSLLWSHAGSSEMAMLLGSASPAEDEGVVVVPYSSGELAALKVSNGRQLWMDSLKTRRITESTAALAHIRANPVIDRGRVFAVSFSGLMVAIDLRSGRRLWEKNIGGYQSFWVAGDYLFTLTGNEELTALERDTGRVLWVRALPRWEDPEDRTEPIVWTGPLLVSDRLIVASSAGKALAVSPYSGDILGTEEMPDGVSVPPVIAGQTVYFLADDATLAAYR
ncbi:MAG: PQQ-binding-like beta-propeller repeat protein [Alphaproteobacteria bacterium]|nr:PQQ-binding-like beta-propeller repeat protein [Alphaproteobacteria bacterium]MBF0251872.1 PQQ-binding-like beta-propeller repeat protein [Alphaproteobacteria bacterium]